MGTIDDMYKKLVKQRDEIKSTLDYQDKIISESRYADNGNLTKAEKYELIQLEDFQKSTTRWMTQDEQDRLKELRNKS